MIFCEHVLILAVIIENEILIIVILIIVIAKQSLWILLYKLVQALIICVVRTTLRHKILLEVLVIGIARFKLLHKFLLTLVISIIIAKVKFWILSYSDCFLRVIDYVSYWILSENYFTLIVYTVSESRRSILSGSRGLVFD